MELDKICSKKREDLNRKAANTIITLTENKKFKLMIMDLLENNPKFHKRLEEKLEAYAYRKLERAIDRIMVIERRNARRDNRDTFTRQDIETALEDLLKEAF